MNAPFRDKSVTLTVVGCLEVLAGLALCGMGALVAFALAFSPEARAAMGQQGPASLALSVAIYPLLGLCVTVLGVGLFAFRRWARTLSLLAGWYAGLTGLLVCGVYATLGPRMFAAAQAAAPGAPMPVPPGIMAAIAAGTTFAILVMPAAIVIWLVGSNDARLTCEWRDARERWTDRCPLSVLALVVLDASTAVLLVPAAFSTPAVVAGRVVTGMPGATFYLATSAVLAVLAVGLYRLRPWAWWGTLALLVVGTLNNASLLRPGVLEEMYRAMGMPEDQVRLLQAMLEPGMLMALALVTMAALAGWLLWVRKHFVRGGSVANAS